MTLEEIATRLSLTRERVRQIELGALKKLWANLNGDEGQENLPRPSRAPA
jgi:DNA-directed RNA polymerase sigma subunit (sigma70/sigma32)